VLAILLGGITFMLCQSLIRSFKPSISVEIGKTETPDVQLGFFLNYGYIDLKAGMKISAFSLE